MSQIKQATQLPEAFKIKTSHYLIGGLGLVTALSWNEAIKQGIKKVYLMPKDQMWPNFVYAISITIFLILVVYLLPDTKKELPHSTQKVLEDAEQKDKINNLENEVNNLKAVNERLYNGRLVASYNQI